LAHVRLVATILVLVAATTSCSVLRRECSHPGIVCVGLVTGYGSVDAGVERQIWLALQDAVATGTVDRIDYIDTVDTRDRAVNIAYFAEADYDIIVTTGAGISDETVAAAEQYPDVLFIVVQPAHEPLATSQNLVKFQFREEQGGFLAGAAAAMVTRTRHVAAVCEARFIDYVERYCEGFAAGVKYVDGHIQTAVIYRDGAEELLFQDTEWGKATAAGVIADGADVVFAVGENTARAALLEAASEGALVIGAQTDAYEEQTEIREQLVTSAILEVREGLPLLISQLLNTQPPPVTYWGDVDLAPFHEFESLLPPAAAMQLSRIRADLEGNNLKTNLPFDAP
jgi:basic membrane protein A and related proteins